jgi:hypothetical protein
MSILFIFLDDFLKNRKRKKGYSATWHWQHLKTLTSYIKHQQLIQVDQDPHRPTRKEASLIKQPFPSFRPRKKKILSG